MGCGFFIIDRFSSRRVSMMGSTIKNSKKLALGLVKILKTRVLLLKNVSFSKFLTAEQPANKTKTDFHNTLIEIFGDLWDAAPPILTGFESDIDRWRDLRSEITKNWLCHRKPNLKPDFYC